MPEDVQVTIGGDLTPLQQSLATAKAQAANAGAAIGKSLGAEGLKGERALHGVLTRVSRDLISAQNPAEALGAVINGLGESFRLTAASMFALLAVEKLAETLYGGFEAANKLRGAIQNALNISTDVTRKSVANVRDDLAQLKKDAEDANLTVKGNLAAGAEVFIESLERGEDMLQAVKQDAQAYHDIMQRIAKEGDNDESRKLSNENAVLALRISGHDKEAEALSRRLKIEDDIMEAKRQGHTQAVALLEQELTLGNQLVSVTEARAAKQKADDVIKEMERQLADEKKRGNEENEREKSPQQQLQDAVDKKMRGFEMWEKAQQSGDQPGQLQGRILQQQGINEISALAAAIQKLHLEKFQKGNENDAKFGERQRNLLDELADAQNKQRALEADAAGFHGAVDSFRREGFAGRIGPNQNEPQLKELREQSKHMARIVKELSDLKGKFGVL